jgi:superfamily II DNA or RNA helicase
MKHLLSMPEARIRLLISPQLPQKDWEALRSSIDQEARRKLLERNAEEFISRSLLWSEEASISDRDCADLLAWLLATERLTIKFAWNMSSGSELGIFHKKIGIFHFPWGDTVAFTGSANESWSAHSINSESVDVFRSWDSRDIERIQEKAAEFAACWQPDPSKLLVLSLSEDSLSRIKAYSREHPAGSSSDQLKPKANDEDGLWPHQKKAFKEFRKAKVGVLEMATGTGKTRTAIAILSSLFRSKDISSAVVSMAGNDLLAQWEKDLRKALTSTFGLALCKSFGSHRDEQAFLLSPDKKILLCSRDNLHSVVKQMLKRTPNVPMAIVHDEVHDLGSPGNVQRLAGHKALFAWRLGLSATPERDYDVNGNAFIEDEIGPVVFRYPLEDAIEEGILAPFEYYPLPYALTQDDKRDLAAVYARKAAAEAAGNPWAEEKLWMELSVVYKKARSKLPSFANFLQEKAQLLFLDSTILFVQDKEFGNQVCEVLIKHTHLYSVYFDTDSPDILGRLARGDLDCLITCHKLSQGIDIPSLTNIGLISSQRGKRETIQRLGRCLRTDPSNPEKVARVLDFYLVDDEGAFVDNSIDSDRFAWLTRLSALRKKQLPAHPTCQAPS